MRALTPSDELEVCRLYRAGQTMAAISAKYYIVPRTVRYILRRNGCESRYQAHAAARRHAEVIELRNKGWPYRLIAATVQLDSSYCRKIVWQSKCASR